MGVLASKGCVILGVLQGMVDGTFSTAVVDQSPVSGQVSRRNTCNGSILYGSQARS